MPRPSRPTAPCAFGPAHEGACRRPVHHVDGEARRAADTLAPTGTPAPATLLAVALTTMSKASPQASSEPALQDGRRPGAGQGRVCALDQRLGTCERAVGDHDLAHARSGERPEHARGARRRRRSAGGARRATATPALLSMSRTRPTPSVLSPEPAVGVEAQGVAGAGQRGPRGGRGDEPERLELERQGDVAAAARRQRRRPAPWPRTHRAGRAAAHRPAPGRSAARTRRG